MHETFDAIENVYRRIAIRVMGTPAAIIIGALIIAATIAVSFRWSIATNTSPGAVNRLDHWTGAIDRCVADISPSRFNCEAQ
jgi:hypothetical protein